LVTATEFHEGQESRHFSSCFWFSQLDSIDIHPVVDDGGFLSICFSEKAFARSLAEFALVDDDISEKSMYDHHLEVIEGIEPTCWGGPMVDAIKSLGNSFSTNFCDDRKPDWAIGNDKECIEIIAEIIRDRVTVTLELFAEFYGKGSRTTDIPYLEWKKDVHK